MQFWDWPLEGAGLSKVHQGSGRCRAVAGPWALGLSWQKGHPPSGGTDSVLRTWGPFSAFAGVGL